MGSKEANGARDLLAPERLDRWANRLWFVIVVAFLLRLVDSALRGDGDIGYYLNEVNSTSGIPGWNHEWAYPPLAGLMMLPLRGMSLDQAHIYVIVVIAIGSLAVCWAAIWRSGLRWRHLSLAYVVLSSTCLGMLFFLRFDAVTVALTLVGLILLTKGRDWYAGLALFAGGVAKSWPFLISAVTGSVMGRWRALAATAAGIVAVSILGWALGTNPWSWVTFARGRELQAESFAALPALWARFLGIGDVSVGYEFYGAVVAGSGLGYILIAILAITGIVALWVTARGRKILFAPRPAAFLSEARLAYLLLATVSLLIISPVLSPQFLMWLVPPIALALGSGWLRREAFMSLVAMALSSAIYPYLYTSLITDGDLFPLIVLTLRDLLMVGIAWSAAARVLAAARKHNSALADPVL